MGKNKDTIDPIEDTGLHMFYPEHERLLKDVVGRYRTQSLFRETNYGQSKSGLEPLWTLKDKDPQNKLPSLKRLYIESKDPTEYTVAIQAFGSWSHWQRLRANSWFSDHADEWSVEQEVYIRSNAIRTVVKETSGGKNAFTAARWIAEGGYKGAKRGRPSNAEVERERKIAARLDEEVEGDAERIGLRVVEGG